MSQNDIQLSRILDLSKELSTIAEASNCLHRKVGAILYNPISDTIITTGVNKTPSQPSPCIESNSCTKYITGKCPIIHAEVNAILSAKTDLTDTILICTYSPCYECSKVIQAVGIKKLYYLHKHHKTDWKYLEYNNIEATQLGAE